MASEIGRTFPYTWEETVKLLRDDPQHQKLMFDSYLTADVVGNCTRFAHGEEFKEALRLLKRHAPDGRRLLDIPAGNGIATVAFASAGYDVTGVDPDPSDDVGRGAVQRALDAKALTARVVDAVGENLPFAEGEFDIVYVRQGLHHAQDLKAMLREYFRVLRSGGVLLACREPVVEDYGSSLKAFLDAQVDHQYYGGEHAFTLEDYRAGINGAGFRIVQELLPYESPINLYPNTNETLEEKILASKPGRLMRMVLPAMLVVRIGMWRLRNAPPAGRLYSFLCKKPT